MSPVYIFENRPLGGGRRGPKGRAESPTAIDQAGPINLTLLTFGGKIMEENERTAEAPAEDSNYIEVIQELKENSVDKKKYDKLKEENKQLLNALVKGETIEQEKPIEAYDMHKEVDELLFGDNTNLEYITRALRIRQHLIDSGKEDPFITQDPTQGTPTEAQRQTAANVAQVLQEIVDFADGDAGVFNAEYQRRIKDPVIMPRAK